MKHLPGRFWFFATGALLAFATSAPNTYHMTAPLHNDGTWIGIGLTIAFVVLLEVGAIGSAIVGLWWLTFALLTLTFVANCAIGAVYLDRADLSAWSSLAAWRASGYGWLMVAFYAATSPVLLATFLHYAIDAARHPTGRQAPALTISEERVALIVAEALRPLLPAPQETYARPVPVVPPPAEHTPDDVPAAPEALQASTETTTAKTYTCPKCGTGLTQSQYGAARRYGYCKQCKEH